jgi:hypothetical protein
MWYCHGPCIFFICFPLPATAGPSAGAAGAANRSGDRDCGPGSPASVLLGWVPPRLLCKFVGSALPPEIKCHGVLPSSFLLLAG